MHQDTLLDRIVKKLGLPYMDIFGQNDDGTENQNDLYLRRYYIYRGKHRPHVYLHHIMRSDYDRAMHDHPWPFTSLILWQGYIEHQEIPSKPTGMDSKGNIQWLYAQWKRKIRPLSIVRHSATDLHRLELTKPAWTLVFTGERERDWGFRTPDKGWISASKLFQYIKDMMP